MVLVRGEAARHRRESFGRPEGPCCQARKRIEQGGDEHVTGDAAQRV
jgi:hypothetical protein